MQYDLLQNTKVKEKEYSLQKLSVFFLRFLDPETDMPVTLALVLPWDGV